VGFGVEIQGAKCAFGRFSWNACWVQARIQGENVIHAIRDLEHRDGVLDLVADLGSASLDAIFELVTSLAQAGATTVAVGGTFAL
jgi:hypothetical protein